MSPTVQTLLLGFFVLTAVMVVGRLIWGRSGLASGLKLFFPIWFAYAAWHMYVGVNEHGYSIIEELPFFILNFSVPALVAYIVLKKMA
ncbi:hypothetical protein DTO96_101623 [Ephemeroptericola cinctiostellae]|uniref:Uncharacterized protein n=1 Tax=Ephemeroptericola cinctiostellae TaxID=2268024 RepID=A0A345DBZ5_9BURK|nr:hypothetical protein [Ephemeroptericola cinctiostellae]AXF85883.1 hypothetical protein DTO96_101623 [Ephemeroptericola cinctiostellae]